MKTQKSSIFTLQGIMSQRSNNIPQGSFNFTTSHRVKKKYISTLKPSMPENFERSHFQNNIKMRKTVQPPKSKTLLFDENQTSDLKRYPTYVSPEQKERISVSRKQLSKMVIPTFRSYYHKFDFKEEELRLLFGQICQYIHLVMQELKGKPKIFITLNKLLKDLDCLKPIFLQKDNSDLLEKYTIESVHQRFIKKAQNIYQQLCIEIRTNYSLMAMRPNQAIFYLLSLIKNFLLIEKFQSRLQEYSELKREEIIETIQDNIINEMEQLKVLQVSSGRYKKPFIDISVSKFQNFSPAVDLERAELYYGLFGQISEQERKYDRKLIRLISHIQSKLKV